MMTANSYRPRIHRLRRKVSPAGVYTDSEGDDDDDEDPFRLN